MISVKLLNTALDAIKNSHPVANELQNCYRDIVLGVPSTNKYGVACKSNSTAKNSKKKAP